MTDDLIFSLDVETDGPVPGINSMLSIGAVALTREEFEVSSFSVNLEVLPDSLPDPYTMKWWENWPEAWAAHRTNVVKPRLAMKNLSSWVSRLCEDPDSKWCGYKPVMMAAPAGFDFSFVYWYSMAFLGSCPFGFSCIDLKSYLMGAKGWTSSQSSSKNWPSSWSTNYPHTHIALDDAREQGHIFFKIMNDLKL